MVERTTDALVAALERPAAVGERPAMTRQPLVARRAEELLGSAVVATAPVAGGDICTATRLRLSDGTTALMKTLPHAPDGLLRGRGRRPALAGRGRRASPCPRCSAADDDCLILRWVEPGRPTADAAARLRPRAGGDPRAPARRRSARDRDGFIGRLPLPNKPRRHLGGVLRHPPGAALPQAGPRPRRDHRRRRRGASRRSSRRLAELVPEEPPARLHGDLWNGNVLWGHDGRVWLIDPAAHGGHRETDLAMLALFGLPHLPRVLDAYDEARPLADGWEDRVGAAPAVPAARARLPVRRRLRRPRRRRRRRATC